jgi:hypothetical protein
MNLPPHICVYLRYLRAIYLVAAMLRQDLRGKKLLRMLSMEHCDPLFLLETFDSFAKDAESDI